MSGRRVLTKCGGYGNMGSIKGSSVRGTRSGFIYSFLCLMTYPFSFFLRMEQGTITRLTDRGFGFISRENEEKDLFFHSNELQGVEFNELQEGDKVTFEVANGPKGLNATNVTRV